MKKTSHSVQNTWTRTLYEGLTAGLLGALAVSVWMLAWNTLSGAHPLATPATLGTLMLEGPDAVEAGVTVHALPVAVWTVFHGVVFLSLGLLTAATVRLIERTPPLIAIIMPLFFMFEAAFYGLLLGAGELVFGPQHLVAVGVANLLAAGVMGSWLWYHHPRLHVHVPTGVLDAFDNVHPLPMSYNEQDDPSDRAAG
ncbi:MAG: hypothetical protein H6739_06205 [Alphaproteobacteria bacterium]|nr:hypothetical protein [Alphaproteobacteria bacterium]